MLLGAPPLENRLVLLRKVTIPMASSKPLMNVEKFLMPWDLRRAGYVH